MEQECKFNPDRDLQLVVESLSIDLNNAIESGMVMPTGVDVEHNGFEQIEDVGERIEDVFDAMNHMNELNELAANNRQTMANRNPVTLGEKSE